MKKQCVEWEKMSENHVSDKRFISKIHKVFTQLNSKKRKKKTNFKNGPEYLNRHFSKEGIQMANRYTKSAQHH